MPWRGVGCPIVGKPKNSDVEGGTEKTQSNHEKRFESLIIQRSKIGYIWKKRV